MSGEMREPTPEMIEAAALALGKHCDDMSNWERQRDWWRSIARVALDAALNVETKRSPQLSARGKAKE